MKRFHVHVNVDRLDTSIRFYTTLFGIGPSVTKPDYAKWMLDDPRLNFAIGQRLLAADAVTLAEKATTCCYAHSDKFWAEDPQGVRWESFHTHGDATTYSGVAQASGDGESAACCGPNVGAACR